MFALSILNTQNVAFFVIHSLATNTSAEPPDVIPLLDPSASTMPKEDNQPNTSAKPPDVIPLLDPSASTMPKEDDQPKKRHCPSKSLDD